MPDWTYRTIFRPVFQAMDFRYARALALGTVGGLGRSSFGRAIIGWMGHMVPDARLRTEINETFIRSPTVIACDFDPEQQAVEAFGQFGCGLVEVGSYLLDDIVGEAMSSNKAEDKADLLEPTKNARILDWTTGSLRRTTIIRSWSKDHRRIYQAARSGIPIGIRIVIASHDQALLQEDSLDDQFIRLFQQTPYATAYFLSIEPTVENWQRLCLAIEQALKSESTRRSCWLRVPAESLDDYIDFAKSSEAYDLGAILLGSTDESTNEILESNHDMLVQAIEALGRSRVIVHFNFREPAQAIECLAVGASAVMIDSALAFSGPGFIKRVNAGELHRRLLSQSNTDSGCSKPTTGAQVPSWIWAVLLGLGMGLGGCLTLYLGVIGVLLPYDEVYLGMTSNELYAKSPRLLKFMAHDRVTLAGTMLTIGIFYCMLGWFGIRRGMHWPMMTILWSSGFGFASFFLFLVFGYFDPLHAFVSATLLQLALQMVQSPIRPKLLERPTCIVDDLDWKMAQWGQLLLVVQAAGLMVAGIAIAILGSTQVFVQEDLAFLQMTRIDVEAIHPRLVGVIAHDRAAFGGMLLSVGAVILYVAMWGFDRGRVWLWWMLFVGGTIGYMTTILVHGCVGYTDFKHLLPANIGLIELWIALSVSTKYLCLRSWENDLAWEHIEGR
jgi:dihydroorotate dehydrogenase